MSKAKKKVPGKVPGKVAVVLLNLGGPNNLDAVEPFLFNLFYDKAIIRLPNPLRWIIAKLISRNRRETAKEIYSLVGGASPILRETTAQKNALEVKLQNYGDISVFISMRYWYPRADEVAQEIKKYDPSQIIILPLYPQFSTTTTESSVQELQAALKKAEIRAEPKLICCYYNNEGFIDSHVALIRAALIKESIKDSDMQNARILFSAHGLPQKIIDQGDPYQLQVERTVAAVIKKLDISNLDYKITYQSKVGPMKWLEPNTEHEIEEAAKLQKTIIVVPIAFVSEHVETLVELDIEYAKIAENYDTRYIRVPTLSTNELFITALESLVLKALSGENLCCNCKSSC
ncbi:MAG: ferrochelatase [Pseudomonadota bacterium]